MFRAGGDVVVLAAKRISASLDFRLQHYQSANKRPFSRLILVKASLRQRWNICSPNLRGPKARYLGSTSFPAVLLTRCQRPKNRILGSPLNSEHKRILGLPSPPGRSRRVLRSNPKESTKSEKA